MKFPNVKDDKLKLIEHHQETCHFGVSTRARSFIEELIELSCR